jgi:hypothetical protein
MKYTLKLPTKLAPLHTPRQVPFPITYQHPSKIYFCTNEMGVRIKASDNQHAQI